MAESVQIQARARTIPTGLIVGIVLALLVILLWLPFGWKVGFTGDDWIYFHQGDAGILFSGASPLRIFLPIPWLIASALTPGQFIGVNLMMALLIFGKACLTYLILRRLSAPMGLAFAAAALTIAVSADTGIFYMGALAIHFALFSYLLALYLFLLYWRQHNLVVLILMCIAQLGCVGIDEIVYPLIAFTPLLLLHFRRKLDGRFVRITLMWYLIPVIYAIWYALILFSFPRASQYETALIARPTILGIIGSVLDIYRRQFLDSWRPTASSSPVNVLLALIAGALIFGICFWLLRRERASFTTRSSLSFVLGGLVIIGLGVALYLPTSLRDDTVRTYYFSMVGAAVALAFFLWWVTRRPVLCALVIGVIAGFGMLHMLEQHQRYDLEAQGEQAVLTDLVRTIPGVESGSGIIVVDETPNTMLVRALHNTFYLDYMLPTLYNDYSLQANICLPADFSASAAHCQFSDSGLIVSGVRTLSATIAYDKLVLLRYDGHFSVASDLAPYIGQSVAAYQPQRLYRTDVDLPARMTAWFGP